MTPAEAKTLVAPLRAALYDHDPAALKSAVAATFAPDAQVHLSHPFNTLQGPGDLLDRAWGPLATALPDLERRDTIVMAGHGGSGALWVGCCGYYTGIFRAPFLDIPPTGHQIGLRFHEFFRIEDARIVEMQALWDFPELMMQAGAWPMGPSLGRDWQVPGPTSQDGLCVSGDGATALRIVSDMLEGLGRHDIGGPPAMRLQDYWHPRCNWYGPAGIGTNRGIEGFRRWHQIPFLNAMPDRSAHAPTRHLFGEGAYVGFTAWPGMKMTLSHDGWLGIAPSGQALTMRSLDFWRVEGGMIRENWVLVDLLDVWAQLGVDVLRRMRDLTGQGWGGPDWLPVDPSA